MKRFPRLLLPIPFLCALLAGSSLAVQAQDNAQQLAFAGLRAVAGRSQFNAVQSDSSGHLYLLLDQKDGVRVLKTDANATQVLSETHFGAQGDIGLALALDPAGNVYVTGTTTSGSLPATPGAPFPAPADSSTNSFVAKLDSSLAPVFITYAGSGRMAASAIAVTADRVFITGGIYAPTLPVTPSTIIQAAAPGSTGNGFVECFNSIGTSLLYATYLSGLDGDTNPSAIAADTEGNVYVAGYTTSSGYPTLAAMVPEIMGSGSGFLTKLSPAGDGILFSTFIPGLGIDSVALDSSSQTLLFSGNIEPGQFPITAAPVPLVSAQYQSMAR
ncbi:MAG TPA: SBBP repeat-containing protein, partial [Edaphobacter sp.]